MEISVLLHTSQKQPTITTGWAPEPLWTWRCQQVPPPIGKKKNSYQVMNLASSPDRRKYKAEFLNRYLFVAPSELYWSLWHPTLRRRCYFTVLTHCWFIQRRPENVAQLRAHIVKLCRALSEDLCRKVVTNARVRLQEVVRQNGGRIEHVLH